jgi:hypothetical protein
MTAEVKQLGPEHMNSLRQLLSKEPIGNLHLLGRLEEMEAAPGASSFFGYFSDSELRAAVFVQLWSGLVIPGACAASDALAMGSGLAGKIPFRTCFGERLSVENLARGLCWTTPRLAMPHRLFTASADNLGPFVTHALRVATERDLAQVNSLAVAEGEEVLGSDRPREHAQAFEAELLEGIRRERTWVFEADGRLLLKVDVAARSSFGAELQGLYTVPEERFRGYATLALGHLSRHLLSSLPRLTVRVADSADSLLAVMRKVGYVNGPTEQLFLAL